MAFQDEDIGESPDRAEGGRIPERVDHEGPIGERREIMGMGECMEGPTDHLVDETCRRLEDGDPRRESLLDPEVGGLPGHRVARS